MGENEKFEAADYSVLYQFETDSHANVVLEQVKDLELTSLDPDSDTTEYRSELVMMISSLRRSETKQKRLVLPKLKDEHRSVQKLSISIYLPELSIHRSIYLSIY